MSTENKPCREEVIERLKGYETLIEELKLGTVDYHLVHEETRDLLPLISFSIDSLTQQREDEKGWQPIETAPKDGTVIWAFNGEQGRMKWTEGDGWGLWIWDDEVLCDIDASPEQPTHWRPLPDPPVSAMAASTEKGEA